MTSILKVDTIQNSTGTDALSIGADGKVSASNGFSAAVGSPALQFIKRVDLSTSSGLTSVTDVFSADFDQYKIIFKAHDTGENQDNTIVLRFLKASDGSEETSSIYLGAMYGRDNTDTARGGGTTNGTNATIVNGAMLGGGELTISDPFLASKTNFYGMTYNYRDGTGIYFYENVAYRLNSTTSYSGVKFMADNPCDGYVLVYGWTGS